MRSLSRKKTSLAVFMALLLFLATVTLSYEFVVTRVEFVEILKGYSGNLSTLKKPLTQCLKKCQDWDAKLAERLEVILATKEKDKNALVVQMPLMTRLLTDAIVHYEQEGNADHLIVVYRAALRHADALDRIKNLPTGEDFQTLVWTGTDKLTERFPDIAEVHYLRGQASDTFCPDCDVLDSMKNYRDCLRVDSTHSGCRSEYQRGLKSLNSLHCDHVQLGDHIKIYLGTDQESVQFSEVGTDQDQNFFMEKKPKLDGNQIWFTPLSVDERDRKAVEIHILEYRTEYFATMTRENFGKRLAIVFDGKVLAAPLIQKEIRDGKVQVQLGVGSEATRVFNQLCPNPKASGVPDDLKL